MTKRKVKDVLLDPRGKEIVLYEDTWHNHISIGHPEMLTRYDNLKDTVQDPDHIREGRKPLTEELYVKQFESDAIFVSTRYVEEQITIVTSSYAGKDKASRGSIKWEK
ncbi:MAG: hypothetical protein WCP16_18455 [Pseudanabaena sp. ELA645]|jgi:hypothetical protein